MWQSLGFKTSPYDATPLKPRSEDVDLLVGRASEMVELCTVLESSPQGIYVISGQPGVGKTSFFNVTQFLMESKQAPCGPSLLCSRALCPIYPADEPRDIAQRAVTSIVKSIEQYCATYSRPLPPETKKISKWISSKGGGILDFGLTILGFGGNFGRSVEISSFSEITFERLQDVIACLVSEVVAVLKLDGVFVVFDNIENLEERHLCDLLLTFRDTLFMTPGVWWILVGQAGLGSLIQTMEPRVFERISGLGLELTPIKLKELHEAIDKRVKRFHCDGNGTAPLPEEVHNHLFNASLGEIRFVFKYSSDICTQFVAGIRTQVLKTEKKISPELVDQMLGRLLVNHQVPSDRAEGVLKHVVRTELDGLNLKRTEKDVLRKIGELRGARPSNFKDFGFKTLADFASNYLTKMHKQNLLVRTQQGRAVMYRLRGLSSLASEYGLLR